MCHFAYKSMVFGVRVALSLNEMVRDGVWVGGKVRLHHR